MGSVLRVSVGAAALGTALLAAPVAAYADGEFLRVTPSTIQAGFQIEIEGFCGDNVNPATVRSDAFGVVTITPVQDPHTGKFMHRGTATIPSDTQPRAYAVTLTCPSQQSAVTTLHVVSSHVPSHGPRTGGGALANAEKPLGGNAFTLAGLGAAVLGSLLLLVRRRKRTRSPAS